MRLLRAYLRGETDRLARSGTRLTVIGRRDRLPPGIPEAIERAEAATASGDRLHLRIAVDYSSRDAILAAAARLGPEGLSREGLSEALGADGDVDLVIRTGARSGSPTSSSGRRPTRSCTSPTGCGPISARPTSP